MKSHFLTTLAACCLATISAAADQLYVLNIGSNNVSVIDTFSNKETALIPVGNEPSAIALAPQTKILYIANRMDNTVDAINAQTHQKISSIHVESHPVGLFITPNEKQVYVLTEGTTSVSVVDTDTYSSKKTIPIGYEPASAAMDHQGRLLYVIGHGSQSITVIDMATSAVVDTISLGEGIFPTGIAILSPTYNPADEVIYLTIPNPHDGYGNGSFVAVNPATHKIVASRTVERDPGSVIIDPAGKLACVINGPYSHNIDLIDTQTYLLSSIPVGSRSDDGVFAPNGTLYITNAASSNVTAIDTQTHAVINTISVGYWPLGCTIDSNGMLYVCNFTGNTISVINTSNNTVIATIPLGGVEPALIVP
jgi:YVTN family beta-propeller protein